MNRYKLVHVTEFLYDGPVSESYNEVRLRPMQDDTQSSLSFRLTTDPPARTSSHTDYFGNWVHRFNVLGEHKRLRVEADSVTLVQEPRPLPSVSLPLTELQHMEEELDEHYDLLAATSYVPHTPGLRDLVTRAERDSDGTVWGFAHTAAHLVHSTFN
ncbi:MAG TPA: transglutaminase N-terminal domain-containing protein, partial [Bryobacteraceae bacterium]|nr:transglutaminase N-terminal domain-containing protein [Bryobacteraceae bacterium]